MEQLKLDKLGKYAAILMDPPWLPYYKGQKGITPEDLVDFLNTLLISQAKMAITDKLIPNGYLFIWVEKEITAKVLTKYWGINFRRY